MNALKRKWVGVGTLVLLSVGGVAAMAVPASASVTSVSTPAPTATDPGVEDGTNDGETADDQVGETPGQETADEAGETPGQETADEAGEVPGQETADDQGVEDGTNDGESADDATATPAP
ncbi:hypothetical protein [Microbacterium binotii]|jgi:hypothetical protein|uniref:Uncharacterized protein n=1 Tax=Microbacterium binotii TaxID=462710 RepID=A0ABN3PFL9_9MICO